LHTSFTSAEEAAGYAQTGQAIEKRTAMSYLERAPLDEKVRDKVATALLASLDDNSLRDSAMNALKTWARSSDVPALRSRLEEMVRQDTDDRSMDNLSLRKGLIQVLGKLGGADSAELIARNMRNFFVRGDTVQALTALGDAAEPPLLKLLEDTDQSLARDVISLLGKIGTEKSIFPLQRVAGGKSMAVTGPANDAVKQIASRLKLKPEQYLYNLINHYTIEGPAGFAAESTSAANTYVWTRTATGRTVKSTYTVAVKLVPADYQLNVPPGNTATIKAGSITFRQLKANSNAATRTVNFAAVDGEYLIDLTATLDAQDRTAETAMNAAVAKIKVKP
jgi:hypothetical protein